MRVKSKTTTKQLKSQRSNLAGQSDAMEIQIRNLQNQKSMLDSQVALLDKQIKQLDKNNGPIKVSEHAIVRFLERGLGMEIEQLNKQIITPEFMESWTALGEADGKYPNGKGVQLVIKNRTITTVT